MKLNLSTRNKILLGILIFLIPLFLYSLIKPKKVIAWFDEAWTYRVRIPITAHTSTEVNVYHDFTVDTSSTGKFQSDCGDIRVTNQTGTLLQYRITSGCGTGSTTLRVFFSSFPSGAQDLYMYYGNVAAQDGFRTDNIYNTAATGVTVGSIGSEEKGSGPIAYWAFNEGVDNTCSGGTNDTCDGSGGKNDGAISNGTAWKTEEYCHSGNCLFFDGSDDIVTVSANSLINFSGQLTNGFTISAWIRPNGAGEGTGGQIFYKGTNSWLRVDTLSNGTLDLQASLDLGTTDATLNVSGVVANNEWNHIALSYTDDSDDEITLWVNGKNVGTSTDGDGSPASDSNDLIIGGTTTNNFNGFIDEFKIFKTELSSAGITADVASKGGLSQGAAAVLGSSVQEQLSQGLVGYWKMDETGWTVDCSSLDVLDSSGNGYNGSSCPISTGPAGGSKVGKFALAGDFDNTNDYVSVSNPEVLGTTYTFAAWINPDTIGNDPIIAYYNSTLHAHLSMDTGGTLRGVAYEADSGSWPLYEIYVASTIDTGSWQHIAFTVDGVHLKLYRNGQIVAQSTIASTATSTGGTEVNFGKYPWTSSYYYDGKMDEVRIYNRALSSDEVEALYTWAPGPIASLDFDHTSGTTVFDQSGRGHNGTMTGTTLVPGKYGQGIYFPINDGTVNYVSLGDDDDFSIDTTNQLSYMAWIYVTNPSAQNYVITRRLPDNYEYDLVANTQFGGQVWSSIMQFDSTEYMKPQNAAITLLPNKWYHIAATVELNTPDAKVYLNGVLAGEDTTASGSYTNGTSSLQIGGGEDTADYQGIVDDFRLYNYVRTPDQILEDMNSGHPPGGSPIGSQVGYWKFDEMTENTCANGSNDVCNSTSYSSTLDGTSTASRTTSGKINGALNFDGSTNVVTIANTNEIDLDVNLNDGFTFSGWINPDTVGEGTGGQVFQKGSNTYCQLSGSDPFTLTCNLDYVTTDANAAVSSAIPAGSWTYVAMTFNSADDTISVWINGTKRSTSSAGTGGKSSDTSNLLIGGGTSNNFDGKIDEFKIYNSTLSQEEILVDMNANAAVNVSVGQKEADQLSDTAGNPPIGWWKLDETSGTTAKDSSGNENSGTTSSTDINKWMPGKYGYALNSEATGIPVETVVVTDPGSGILDFGTGSFSIMGWVNVESNPFSGRPFTKGFYSGSVGYGFEINGTLGTWEFNAGDSGTAANRVIVRTATLVDEVAPNQWYHIAGVVNKTTNRVFVYVNGIPQTITKENAGDCGTESGIYLDISSCTIDVSNGSNFEIGGINGASNNQPFDGGIDDVKVYDYARSQAQIMYDYNRGRPIGWWKLDDCQGTTVYDASGYGKNGTISVGGTPNSAVGTCNSGNSTDMWYNGRTGKINSSLDFDGTDDLVTVSDDDLLDFVDGQDFSIAFWMNLDATTSDQAMVTKKNSQTAGDAGYMIFFNDPADVLDFRVSDSSGDGSDQFIVTSNTFSTYATTGEWVHVVAVFDESSDTNSTIYINGRDAKASTTGTIGNVGSLANAIDMKFGTQGNGSSDYGGKLDDIRLYNYALSANQVKAIYNNDTSVFFGPATGPTP